MLTLCLLLLAAAGGSVSLAGVRVPAAGGEADLSDLLIGIGKKYDRRFTLELIPISDSNNFSIQRVDVPEGQERFLEGLEGKSLGEAMESLKGFVPHMQYSFAPGDEKVVNVLDSRLARDQGYVMGSVVKELSYEGYLHELPDAIGKLGLRSARKSSAI